LDETESVATRGEGVEMNTRMTSRGSGDLQRGRGPKFVEMQIDGGGKNPRSYAAGTVARTQEIQGANLKGRGSPGEMVQRAERVEQMRGWGQGDIRRQAGRFDKLERKDKETLHDRTSHRLVLKRKTRPQEKGHAEERGEERKKRKTPLGGIKGKYQGKL